ncbi:MAG: hypothetical protein ABL893_21085 [Hyphomicrobium sp.]
MRTGLRSRLPYSAALFAAAAIATLQAVPPVVPDMIAGEPLAALEWPFRIPSPHADFCMAEMARRGIMSRPGVVIYGKAVRADCRRLTPSKDGSDLEPAAVCRSGHQMVRA